MNENTIAMGGYASALAEASSHRGDRLNSWDETMHWTVVRRLLIKHAPAEPGSGPCLACHSTWPCPTIAGAIKDLRLGISAN